MVCSAEMTALRKPETGNAGRPERPQGGRFRIRAPRHSPYEGAYECTRDNCKEEWRRGGGSVWWQRGTGRLRLQTIDLIEKEAEQICADMHLLLN
jgi:hypothetical protein